VEPVARTERALAGFTGEIVATFGSGNRQPSWSPWRDTAPVIEIGGRQRSQPAPPRIVFDALIDPDRDPARPWLNLCSDEQRPRVVHADRPGTVVWSSLWPSRADAIVEFDLPAEGGGTALRWTLRVDEPIPDAALITHLCHRLNQLINANLRYSFGQ
jgi:hypothetical protein